MRSWDGGCSWWWAALAVLAAWPAAAQTRSVTLAPPGTRVEFTTYAMGFWALEGHFTKFSGTLSVDPAHAADCVVNLDVDVGSLQMADAARTRTALGPKLLDQAHFPTLSYRGSCAGGHPAGQLSLHGVTRTLELATTRHGQTVVATGSLRRAEYGVDGMPAMIGRTIKLSFAVDLPDELASLVDP